MFFLLSAYEFVINKNELVSWVWYLSSWLLASLLVFLPVLVVFSKWATWCETFYIRRTIAGQNMRLMACIIAFFIWQRKNLNSICRSYVAQMFLKCKKNFWLQGGQSIIFNNCPAGTLHFKCEIHFYFLVERSCTTRMSHELWPLHFLWQSIK